jgi:hypothetical protein
MEPLTLNNGVEMPALGLGVFQTPRDAGVRRLVLGRISLRAKRLRIRGTDWCRAWGCRTPSRCAAFLAIYWIYCVRYEEPGLERRFGEEYRAYRRRVPRWIPRRIRDPLPPGERVI